MRRFTVIQCVVGRQEDCQTRCCMVSITSRLQDLRQEVRMDDDAVTVDALMALPDLEPDAPPETLPTLGRDGLAAAAWRAMPLSLTALIRHRNPAMSVHADYAAG